MVNPKAITWALGVGQDMAKVKGMDILLYIILHLSKV